MLTFGLSSNLCTAIHFFKNTNMLRRHSQDFNWWLQPSKENLGSPCTLIFWPLVCSRNPSGCWCWLANSSPWDGNYLSSLHTNVDNKFDRVAPDQRFPTAGGQHHPSLVCLASFLSFIHRPEQVAFLFGIQRNDYQLAQVWV